MKKNDLALIIFVVAVTAIITYFAAQAIVFGGSKEGETVEVETAEVIQTTVATPDPKVFNSDAINPTVKIEIGNIDKKQPFNN